jgi:hypothetical protein
MRTTTSRLIWLALLLVVLACVAVSAAPERALPQFSVVGADGQPRAAAALTAEARWLLIYVDPESPPCARLLRLLEEWQSAQLVARTVLVVGGTVEEAQAFITRRMPQALQDPSCRTPIRMARHGRRWTCAEHP